MCQCFFRLCFFSVSVCVYVCCLSVLLKCWNYYYLKADTIRQRVIEKLNTFMARFFSTYGAIQREKKWALNIPKIFDARTSLVAVRAFDFLSKIKQTTFSCWNFTAFHIIARQTWRKHKIRIEFNHLSHIPFIEIPSDKICCRNWVVVVVFFYFAERAKTQSRRCRAHSTLSSKCV